MTNAWVGFDQVLSRGPAQLRLFEDVKCCKKFLAKWVRTWIQGAMDILELLLAGRPPVQANFIPFHSRHALCQASAGKQQLQAISLGFPLYALSHIMWVTWGTWTEITHSPNPSVWFLIPCTSRQWRTVVALLPPSTQSLNKALNEQLFGSKRRRSSFLWVIWMDLSLWTKPWPSVLPSNHKCRKS